MPLKITRPTKADKDFYVRADAHISLSNDQLDKNEERIDVAASMTFATARFNVWSAALNFRSGEELAKSQEQLIEFCTIQYREMLKSNLGDYIANFDKHVETSKKA